MRQGPRVFNDKSKGIVKECQSGRYRQRIEIVVLHRCNISSYRIAWFCNCHLRTVTRWIIRIELGEPLSDRFRSGRPPIFPQDICLKAIAFYCQTTPLLLCSNLSSPFHKKVHKNQDYVKTSITYSLLFDLTSLFW